MRVRALQGFLRPSHSRTQGHPPRADVRAARFPTGLHIVLRYLRKQPPCPVVLPALLPRPPRDTVPVPGGVDPCRPTFRRRNTTGDFHSMGHQPPFLLVWPSLMRFLAGMQSRTYTVAGCRNPNSLLVPP